MTVTFFKGRPRTGKTLHLTMNAYFDFKNGRKIYSNYNLHFPHTRLGLNDVLGLATMEMDITPKTVCLQEVDKWFDARRSGREENVALSSFTGQSGKREIDILYDSQFPTRVDKSLRDITEIEVYCECVRDDKRQPVAFSYTLIDLMAGTTKTYKIPAFMMHQFYDLYDTREPTKRLETKKVDK